MHVCMYENKFVCKIISLHEKPSILLINRLSNVFSFPRFIQLKNKINFVEILKEKVVILLQSTFN
jgi:hypothetical protein